MNFGPNFFQAPPGQIDGLELASCEKDFHYFVSQAWSVVEDVPFVDGWHIHFISEHLQAVHDGEIKKLLVNVPPGCSKSLLTSVFWPAWRWAKKPSLRMFCASYSFGLTVRDADRCRKLIASEWYQQRWGDRVQIRANADSKVYYETTAGGYRMSTTPGGRGTGEHPDTVVCFPASELVWTSEGPIAIGRVVEEKKRLDVWSFDVATGRCGWKPVTGWHTNPGRLIVKVRLSDGTAVECTPDHRIWTGRGWVEAGRLVPSVDFVPSVAVGDSIGCLLVDSESNGKVSLPFPILEPGAKFADLFSSELGVAARSGAVGSFAADQVFSNVAPRKSLSDAVDCCCGDLQSFCDRGVCFFAGVDFSGHCIGEFGAFVGSAQHSAMSFGVVDVLLSGSVRQVCEGAVCAVAVGVPDFATVGDRSDECQHDALVNAEVFLSRCSGRICGVESRVAVASGWRFDDAVLDCVRLGVWANHLPAETFDASKVADLVIRQAGDCFPRFVLSVEHVGFAPKTYCLSVADYRTFCAGSQPVIVRNCDDPHSVLQAESKAKRQAVLDWWDYTITTRGVSRDPSRVIIMQRLRQEDLSGHVLEHEDGWTHVCLPMRYEPGRGKTTVVVKVGPNKGKVWEDPRKTEGELLCPEQIKPEKVKEIERSLGTFGAAGQLQQRPVPRSGGIFQNEWFKIVKRAQLPKQFDEIVRYWDKGGGDDGDPTAGVLMGRKSMNVGVATPQNRYFVLDVVKGDWTAGRRDDLIDLTASLDETEWGTVRVRFEQEPGSGGKQSAEISRDRLAGHYVSVEKPTTNKEARAEEYAVALEFGEVFLLEGDWNQTYIDELCEFPRGAHDDQVDASSGAYNFLARRKPKAVAAPASNKEAEKDKQAKPGRVVECASIGCRRPVEPGQEKCCAACDGKGVADHVHHSAECCARWNDYYVKQIATE